MIVMNVVIGIAALTFGRKLFWFFVGAIGFVAATNVTVLLFRRVSEWLVFVIAIISGLLGALLAVLFQRLAVVAAGFAGGGYLILFILNMWRWQTLSFSWLLVLLGAVAGAVFLYLIFDWTLIFLSSMVGASLITEALSLNYPISGLLLLGLFAVGFMIQMKMMDTKPK